MFIFALSSLVMKKEIKNEKIIFTMVMPKSTLRLFKCSSNINKIV